MSRDDCDSGASSLSALEYGCFDPLERFLRSVDQTDIASVVVEMAARTVAIAADPKIGRYRSVRPVWNERNGNTTVFGDLAVLFLTLRRQIRDVEMDEH